LEIQSGKDQGILPKVFGEMIKLTPAEKLAMAYCHVTGMVPKGVRLETYLKVYDNSEFFGKYSYFRKLNPEFVEAVQDHPFVIAHNWLIKDGFYPDVEKRKASHYITYKNADGRTATTYRTGGYVTIVPESGKWSERIIVNYKDFQ
jgi:hypothetical protein